MNIKEFLLNNYIYIIIVVIITIITIIGILVDKKKSKAEKNAAGNYQPQGNGQNANNMVQSPIAYNQQTPNNNIPYQQQQVMPNIGQINNMNSTLNQNMQNQTEMPQMQGQNIISQPTIPTPIISQNIITPNNITPIMEQSSVVPNNMAPIMEQSPVVPNNMAPTMEQSPVVPNNMAPIMEQSPVVPNNMAPIMEQSPVVPNNMEQVMDNNVAIQKQMIPEQNLSFQQNNDSFYTPLSEQKPTFSPQTPDILLQNFKEESTANVGNNNETVSIPQQNNNYNELNSNIPTPVQNQTISTIPGVVPNNIGQAIPIPNQQQNYVEQPIQQQPVNFVYGGNQNNMQ